MDVGGLSLAAVHAVLAALDTGPGSLPRAVSSAHEALGRSTIRPADGDPPVRARALIAELGWTVDPDSAALSQLDTALAAVAAVGLTPTPERLRTYADAALSVARLDIAEMPAQADADVVAFVVLGTVLYEPVLLALRRLAQQHVYRGPDPC